jgi:tRNA pseudouridine13 synthase
VLTPVLRLDSPEDFQVDEIPLYRPTGEGEHTFVRVEKRNRTTEEVARDLARAAGVLPREVGYAGRKDRVAVATQWFSVPRLAPDAALRLALPGVRVLEASAHAHRLRTGQLRGNRFRVVVRDLGTKASRTAERRLQRLVRVGLPNRFGGQRFGREGRNAELGRRLLAGELRLRDRRRARFLLSALQAEVFNAVLAEREPHLQRLECGDVAVIHASGALFRVEDPLAEAPRAAVFEISATGPIFGTRVLSPEGEVAARERAVLESHGVPAAKLQAPRGIRMRGARRALRVRPEETRVESIAGALRLGFTLPPGSYATVLIEELLAQRGG